MILSEFILSMMLKMWYTSLCTLPLDIFKGVMGLSTCGRFRLSAQNEAMKVKHREYNNEIGRVSLTYLLDIGGIQILFPKCIAHTSG